MQLIETELEEAGLEAFYYKSSRGNKYLIVDQELSEDRIDKIKHKIDNKDILVFEK